MVILLCLNCFLCYKLITVHRNFQEENIQILKTNTNYSNRINEIKDFIELQYKLENFLSENIINTEYSHWEGNRHIVLLFNNNQCTTCIQKILLDFSLVKQKTGFTNFIIMGCFKDENDFLELINQLDNEFRHEYLVDKYLLLRELKYPIVFIVDDTLNIKYLYSPDLLPEKRNWYFYSLITQYISMKY